MFFGVKAEVEVHVTKKIKVDSTSWYWYFELSSFCMSSIVAGIGVEEVDHVFDASVRGLHGVPP